MTWNSASIPAVRGRLARYLGQLRHNLDTVGEQVRESVANAVGRTVAEVVGDAVSHALVPHADASSSTPRSARPSSEPSSSRRDYDERNWEREAEDALWRDPYLDDDEDDEPRSHRVPDRDKPVSVQIEQRSRRGQEALAAGVQAAAWWLRRQRGSVSLLAAVTVGAIAGLTLLIGPAGNAADLVASALGLAYLLDMIRSVSNLLSANLASAWTRV